MRTYKRTIKAEHLGGLNVAVTFEDGTRMRTLTADDFDENGHCTIRFIKARGVTTSVCHRTYIYQDGKLLYTNK
mgnify:CR=1 FL=1